MTTDSLFLEVGCAQRVKEGERICGDSFFSRKIQEEMVYPGQIKITVIRETRSVAFAK